MQSIDKLILEDIQKFIASLATPEESYNCDMHRASSFLDILFIEHIIKKWDDEWLRCEYGITIANDNIIISDIYGYQSILLSDPTSYNKIGCIIQGMQCLI